MANYYIDNINLFIAQSKLHDALNKGDLVFVGQNDLDFVQKVMLGSYYQFRLDGFQNGSYSLTVTVKLTDEIFRNKEAMKEFLEKKRKGYKKLLAEFQAGKVKFPNKELFIKNLYELDNSEYLKITKSFLSFFNPEMLEEHEESFSELIKTIN
jgi:hypothetical protein